MLNLEARTLLTLTARWLCNISPFDHGAEQLIVGFLCRAENQAPRPHQGCCCYKSVRPRGFPHSLRDRSILYFYYQGQRSQWRLETRSKTHGYRNLVTKWRLWIKKPSHPTVSHFFPTCILSMYVPPTPSSHLKSPPPPSSTFNPVINSHLPSYLPLFLSNDR